MHSLLNICWNLTHFYPLQMKKYNLGVLYLSQALEANTKAVKAAPQGKDPDAYEQDFSIFFMYNFYHAQQ